MESLPHARSACFGYGEVKAPWMGLRRHLNTYEPNKSLNDVSATKKQTVMND